MEMIVHNMNISYDDSQYHISHFLVHLNSDKMRNKFHEYCELAKKSFDFETEIKGNKGYDYILKYAGNNRFNLRLK
jgi:hypothetical protein